MWLPYLAVSPNNSCTLAFPNIGSGCQNHTDGRALGSNSVSSRPAPSFQLPFLRSWCWENSGRPVLVPVPLLVLLWSWLYLGQCVFVKADFEARDVSLPWGALLTGESRT